jgi:hypothetical protein
MAGSLLNPENATLNIPKKNNINENLENLEHGIILTNLYKRKTIG